MQRKLNERVQATHGMLEVEEACPVALCYSSLSDHGNTDAIPRVFVGFEIRHHRMKEVQL
jgi:hypothetical protein